MRFYPHLNSSQLQVVLVHAGERILPELNEKLGEYAARKLSERGVKIHLNNRVKMFRDCVNSAWHKNSTIPRLTVDCAIHLNAPAKGRATGHRQK